MAELDPLVAKILLKGDDQFLASLKKVGEDAASTFEKLSSAVSGGLGPAEALSGSLGLIAAAITGATAATVAFVEQQTELSQKTILLAQAFGSTAGQLQDIEAVFASSGVKVEQFERFANRLTITIAREWPQIAESIKVYATENDAATLRVATAILRVRDAQKALADNSAERSAQIAKDNNSLEASYIKLQFAAQHSAQEQIGALQSVRGAQLSVTAALQHLAELEGRPPSAADKRNLEIAQAQQAVDTARKAEADARLAQQEKAATAALKQRQLEQEYDDLSRKAAKNARDDAEQRVKDENAIKEAIIQRAEAEQKADKLALTSIVSIRSALDGIVAGNKDASKQIDLTQVSVQNLTKGVIALASENAKGREPTGLQTMQAISKLLTADTEHLISAEQRLALVNHLAATGMQALGGAGAELLHVLEHNSEELKTFSEQAAVLNTKEAQDKVEAFRGALASLNLTISILSQRFAIAVSPAFTAFLRAVKSSLDDSNGVLHLFIDGLIALGSAIGNVIGYINQFISWVAKMFDIEPAALWKGIIVAIGVAVAATATAFLAWPIILATIVTAIGYIADNWDKVKKGAENAWQAVKDSTVVAFFEGVVTVLKSIVDFLTKIVRLAAGLKGLGGTGAPAASPAGTATEGGNVQSNARGGYITGPGSGTSDSILSRLSNGEFVVKAKAVAAYGANLFHALNNMELPGFAQGGLVPSPVRMGGGGSVPATSTLNLSIDGRSFNGLRGPKSTVDDLSAFAISRQTSAAGTNPSWMK